jgi:hypothetical protein
MKEVIFTVDFATKKKGESFLCDSMLASTLVNIDKVAKYAEKPKAKKTE